MTIEEDPDQEIHIKGAPVIGGIGIGPLYFMEEAEEQIPEFSLAPSEVEGEIHRYRRALISSREDLARLKNLLVEEGSDDASSIIEAHIQMLEDPLITNHIEEKIREMRKNTEAVFQLVLKDYEAQWTADGFFQQRLADIKDLSKRVLGNLSTHVEKSFKEIPLNSIVVAKELGPSVIASIQASRVSAFITHRGGKTSHTAVIANEKEAGYVYSVDPEELKKAKNRYGIVNGETGEIILNPSKNTLAKYERLKSLLKEQTDLSADVPCETLDGVAISLSANINSINDIDLMLHHKADGVGLFRSEIPFLQDKHLYLNEELQCSLYQEMFQKVGDRPFVFRLADMGGDKHPEGLYGIPLEPNPALGCRGVKFLIRHKEILRIQIRALLKASVGKNVRILIPLISDLHEAQEINKEIKRCKEDLIKEGYSVKDHIPIGSMLEVPAAALICDILAQESDFLAIGTNDLAQYCLGIDRSNSSLDEFYYPLHLSLIRMVKMIVIEAKKWEKPVSICGEIVTNPLFIPLFLGLGVRHFSVAPRFLPALRKTILTTSIFEATEITEEALMLPTSEAVVRFLERGLYRT